MRKVVFVGDAGVGKTSIIYKHLQMDVSAVTSSVGGASWDCQYSTPNGTCKFQVWDTAGSEQYQSMAPFFIRDAVVAVCVFDLGEKLSFDNVDSWINLVHDSSGQKTQVILVGNKSDRSDRVVSHEEGNDKAKAKGARYFETSAFDGTNIESLWGCIGNEIAKVTRLEPETVAINGDRQVTCEC